MVGASLGRAALEGFSEEEVAFRSNCPAKTCGRSVPGGGNREGKGGEASTRVTRLESKSLWLERSWGVPFMLTAKGRNGTVFT